jgi:hypothetical protein
MAPVIGFYLADVAAQEQRPCPTGKFKSSLSFDECQTLPELPRRQVHGGERLDLLL